MMGSRSARWRSGWRQGVALLAHLAEDPREELLAMVWGPRFDREEAIAVLLQWDRASTTALRVLHQAADRYDALRPHQQARVRRLARQGLSPPHQVVDNAACLAFC
jgi:hypothetical protein